MLLMVWIGRLLMLVMVLVDVFVLIWYLVWFIFVVLVGSMRFCVLIVLMMLVGVRFFVSNVCGLRLIVIMWVCLLYGNGICVFGMVISCGCRKLSVMLVSDCLLSVLFDSLSWIIGMFDVE